MLQAKVGTGDVDEKKVARSQAVIESDKTDFVPMAHEFFDNLERALQAVPQKPENVKQAIQPVIVEIMQIKANASMFNYTLVGTLAGIVLNFLENLQTWDEDTYTIVDAHLKTLRVIVSNSMKGDGGEYGHQLATELRDACQRYFSKHAGAMGSGDAFFVDGK